MKILFVASFTGIGGAERSLMPLARQLEKDGHELTLFLARPPLDAAVFAEFPGSVDTPKGRAGENAKTPAQFVHLAGLVRRTDLVVATSELTVTYAASLLALCWRKPLVADVQVHLSNWIRDNCHPAHRFVSRLIYPRIRGIRCVSKGVAEDLSAAFGVKAERIVIIPVPFDLELIRRASEQAIGGRDEPIFQRPVIVGAGRLTSQKRFDVAIRAFEILRRRDGIDANLLILGEGEERTALEQLASELGVGDRVFLPGHVENVSMYLRRASAFLLSSDYEGLPRVLIEALAVGCPAVATDCDAGPAEILDGGAAGLLAPCGDAGRLAAGLTRVLTDEDLSRQARKIGPLRVEAFDAKVVVQTYCDWLRQFSSN